MGEGREGALGRLKARRAGAGAGAGAPRGSAARAHEEAEAYMGRMAEGLRALGLPAGELPGGGGGGAAAAKPGPGLGGAAQGPAGAPRGGAAEWLAGGTGLAGSARVDVDLSDRPLLCLSVRDGLAVAGGSDHGLYEVDLAKGRRSRQLHSKRFGHQEWVTCVAHLRDGRILSGGMDSKLCLWDARGVRCAELPGHRGSVSCVQTDRESPVAVTCSYDKTVRCWDLGKGRPTEAWCMSKHRAPVLALAWGRGGLVASGARDGKAVGTDLATGKALWTLDAHQGHCTSLAWGRGGVLYTGGQDGHVRGWDFRDDAGCFDLPAHVESHRGSGAVGDILVHEDGDKVVTVGADLSVCVMDVRKAARPAHTFRDHGDFVYSALLSGDLLLTGDGSGAVLSHDVRRGELLERLPAQANAVRCLALDGPGRRLVLAGDDGDLTSLAAP